MARTTTACASPRSRQRPPGATNSHPGSIENNAASETDQAFCSATRRLILRKSRRLAERAGLPESDQADVAQELRQVLVRARAAFDPARGDWLPFAERALQRGCQNLLRDRFAEQRDPRRRMSLHVTVKVGPEDGYAELAQLMTNDDAGRRNGVCRPGHEDQVDLRLDVAEFLATLPPELRQLARDRMQETLLEISRRTGVARSTLYGRLAKLRRLAENTGLAEYFGGRPTKRPATG